jgi:hypothetical protein
MPASARSRLRPYGMLLFCIVTVFLGGLMMAVAAVVPSGLAEIGNAGPHGYSEIPYAYTSAAATNGSAFAGLNANTTFYNLTLALAMFIGRFLVMVRSWPSPDRSPLNRSYRVRRGPCRPTASSMAASCSALS